MAELLVVIAIIAIVAAIMQPVIVRAKQEAGKTTCQSNMRQLYIVLAMYRDAVDGIDAPAPAADMGFPPGMSPITVEPVLGTQAGRATLLTCTSPVGYPYGTTRKPIPIICFWPDLETGDQVRWTDFASREGARTVVLVDLNHQKQWPVTSHSTQFAMGMTISGSLRLKTRRGDSLQYEWWME